MDLSPLKFPENAWEIATAFRKPRTAAWTYAEAASIESTRVHEQLNLIHAIGNEPAYLAKGRSTSEAFVAVAPLPNALRHLLASVDVFDILQRPEAWFQSLDKHF